MPRPSSPASDDDSISRSNVLNWPDGSLTLPGEVSYNSDSGEEVRIPSIARRQFILLVFAAIVATLGCTRASSPTTRTRSLKPTLSTHPSVSSKPAEDESPASAFLPIESW
jgi:hypothetical protein